MPRVQEQLVLNENWSSLRRMSLVISDYVYMGVLDGCKLHKAL